jgi:asparaginyl-tRNA synthetase
MEIPKPIYELSEEELERRKTIGRIMTYTQRYLANSFLDEGFEWLRPVILSPSTDPLWPDPGASIEKRIEVEIYENNVRTTLSMIIHKLIACSLAYPKLFIFSPNLRIEKRERAYTGIHLYEFTQLDFEMRHASSRDVMSFVERNLNGLVKSLRKDMKDELNFLGNGEIELNPPFKVYDREELEEEYGKGWESRLISEIYEPVWVVNIPREFYDFEDEDGRWDNYDLFLPNFGEVLSGAKREWEYKKIIKKMEKDGVDKARYKTLLNLAENEKLKPTAGAGIGIERLVGWIVKANHIGEVQPFPKVPGIVYEL